MSNDKKNAYNFFITEERKEKDNTAKQFCQQEVYIETKGKFEWNFQENNFKTNIPLEEIEYW
jgi:hypothetical protein